MNTNTTPIATTTVDDQIITTEKEDDDGKGENASSIGEGLLSSRKSFYIGLLSCIVVEIIVIVIFSIVLATKDSSSSHSHSHSPSSSDDSDGGGGSYIIVDGLDPNIPNTTTVAIEIPKTCQSIARDWLNATTTTIEVLTNEMRLGQRYALAVFYCELNGEDWIHNDLWLSDDASHHECEWYNNNGNNGNDDDNTHPTSCDEEGRIQYLRLPDNALWGTIPEELSILSTLKEIDFSYNTNITGSFPSTWMELRQLQTLKLSSTSINDGPVPTELLFGFPNMIDLRLDGMDLWGTTIPTSISLDMPDLTILHLQDNGLSFEIPSTLGELSNLQELRLENNDFSGTIPPEIFNLPNLQLLYLHGNNLSGTIPQELEIFAASVQAQGDGEDSQLQRRVTFYWNLLLEGIMPEEACQALYDGSLVFYHVDCNAITCACCTCGCNGFEGGCFRPGF